MSLSRFDLIVSVDGGNGIAKEGDIPWNTSTDRKFFRETTIGKGRNVVIMGRVTYETIPEEQRPLEGRKCLVISRMWKQEDHPDAVICPTLENALSHLGKSVKNYDNVFIYGGEQIYMQVMKDYLYLCNRIYVTKYKKDYDCDQHFPFEMADHFQRLGDPVKTKDYTRYVFLPNAKHDEDKYLQLAERILTEGESKMDRTNTGTTSLFGEMLKFDISERIPILTTKKINYENIIKELLFFISGRTNTKILESQGVGIWKGNTSREFLNERSLDYEEGMLGPLYPVQWRHWGAEYTGYDEDLAGKGIDQLQNVIDEIKNNPNSRRHIVSSWNVADLNKMVLNPCHVLFQLNVSADGKFLDCILYQRSGDYFLGVPYNIASYAMLTYMIAHITGKRPRNLTIMFGDVHIYDNHQAQIKKQKSRTPFPFPTLTFRRGMKLKTIDDFTLDSFVIQGYRSWEGIRADMAV